MQAYAFDPASVRFQVLSFSGLWSLASRWSQQLPFWSLLRFHTRWQLPPDHNDLLTSAIPTVPSSLLLPLTGHSTRSLWSLPKPLVFWRAPHPIMETLRSCFPLFQPISLPSHDPLLSFRRVLLLKQPRLLAAHVWLLHGFHSLYPAHLLLALPYRSSFTCRVSRLS